jgi:hypothetical protein
MTISGQSMSLLDSVLSAEASRADYGVAVLKKAQNADQQQGEAMVQLLEQAAAPVSEGKLDAYA